MEHGERYCCKKTNNGMERERENNIERDGDNDEEKVGLSEILQSKRIFADNK